MFSQLNRKGCEEMKVTLYQNFSENNAIGKLITEIAEVQARLKEQVSALDILLELKASDDILQNVNYLSIQKFKRKYFVIDKDIVTNGLCVLRCHVDVLDSFLTDIKNLDVIASKSQQSAKSDLYIDDGSFITENRLVNQIYNFPNGFNNNGEFILITVGG